MSFWVVAFLWRSMSMEQRDGNCHKISQIVVHFHKLSWRFSQIVVTLVFSRPLPAACHALESPFAIPISQKDGNGPQALLPKLLAESRIKDDFACFSRRRTNVQQQTWNMDLSCSFYYLFFSFVLLELKHFVLKVKVLGEKSWRSVKIDKKCENYERFCPLVVAL